MSSLLLEQPLYTISNIKLSAPSTSSKIFRDTFRIEIIDGDKSLLKSVERKFRKDQIVWDQEIPLSVTAESIINLRVLEGKKVIGEQITTVSGLLDTQESSESGICTITLENGNELSFSIKENLAEKLVEEGKGLLSDIQFEGGESWSAFMAYFKKVKMAADPIVGLNSYAQQAWSILSAIPEMVQTHFTRNANLMKLLQRLMDIYKYIADANRLLTPTTNQIQNFRLLFQQTLECSYFIKKYADRNTIGRIWNGPAVDNKIVEFKEVFDRLFNAIQNSIILEISIVTVRVSKSVEDMSKLVDEIKDSHLLSEMPYAQNTGFVDRKKCLPGTRQKLINEILEWVEKDTSKRVLVLSGQAGMGKSAVAHSIAQFHRTQNRLGSLFCFNRSDKTQASFLFPTISRDLADGDVLWRRGLVKAIESTAIRKSLDPVTQFNEMFIKPSRGTETIGPVVIVIDALDESGDRLERETLLNLLFERSSELPRNYRLIITSRPELDIKEQYEHPNVFCKHIADANTDDTLSDIQQFISHKLSTAVKILDTKFKQDWRLELAEKSQGLFQWANLACLYINPAVRIGLVDRARTVITRMSSSLYELYHQILDGIPEFQVEGFFTMFHTVIGAIIVSRKPLSVSALEALFGPDIESVTVDDILQPFHSLLIGVDNPMAEIRPLHTSLFDFFLSPELTPGTSNRYYIDTSDQSSFTLACLRIMNSMLRFNICGLETSHLDNVEVPNFNSRVAAAIPSQLSYACCFWAYHLEYSHLNADILQEIQQLMDVNLLYLFEVLSLIGEVEHGHISMRILEQQAKDKYTRLAAQAADAWRFADKFGDIMMKSTPHLYISALPLTPRHLFIYKQFISQYPQLLNFEGDQSPNFRIQDSSIEKRHHEEREVCSLAFSPQARLLAACFVNGDFLVWDHVTGKDIDKRGYKGDEGYIDWIKFSQSGDLVYCYYLDTGDVRTWNAKTNTFNKLSIDGLHGYYAAVSPDGRYVVSGTEDADALSELVLYDTATRLTHHLHKESKPWSTMSFSPSGRIFGFLGVDTSYLWDTQIQTHIPPFITGCWRLKALTDSYILAKVGRSVEVWGVQTRTKVSQLNLNQHFGGQFNFFPNEKYLLHYMGRGWSIWNILTGDLIVTRFHESFIGAIAISPDSKHIALGDIDGRTHVLAWDTLVQNTVGDTPSGDVQPLSAKDCGKPWLKGRYLLQMRHVDHPISGPTFFIHIMDATKPTSTPDDELQVHSRKRKLVTISPEDTHWSVAYIGTSGGLCLWNIDEKQEFVLNPCDDITLLAFSADGDRLIDCDSKGHNINIWDVRTRQLISANWRPIPKLKQIDALALSPTGTFFIAYTVYDVFIPTGAKPLIEEQQCESRRIVRGPLQYDLRPISVCSIYGQTPVSRRTEYDSIFQIAAWNLAPKFSPNGKYVAWVSWSGLALWDKETSVVLKLPFNSHVALFSFSVDSMKVIVLTCNQYLVIWDIQAARTTVTLRFPRFNQQILDDSLCPQEHGLFTIHDDRIGRLWNLRVLEIMTPFYSFMLPRPLDNLETSRMIEDYRLNSEDIKTLEYVQVAWNKARFSLSTEMDDHGWVLGPHGELLFWVPEEMRKHLWYPCMTSMTYENPIKLNFDKFVHGEKWTECRMQPNP